MEICLGVYLEGILRLKMFRWIQEYHMIKLFRHNDMKSYSRLMDIITSPSAKSNEVKYKASTTIGHFRVTLCLCFKTSLRAKPFI